ncbi:MAG: phage minor capsid protein [Deltaproteobacteria bacterium]|nr:phage minor capsid protein [Deltaproteobacteria bacterium]
MAAARELSALLSDAKTVEALSGHYQRTLERIISELSAGVSRASAARATSLVSQINKLIDDLDPKKAGYVRKWIRKRIPQAYVLGDKAATRQLRESLERASSTDREVFGEVATSFTPINQTQMRAVAAAMESTMGSAAAQMRAAIGTVIRQTQVTLHQSEKIREQTVSGYLRGATARQVSDDIASVLLQKKVAPEVRARLSREGFSADLYNSFERVARGQIIQVGDRRMSVRAYADLVARTQLREAHKVATITRLQQNGTHHVRISRHLMPEPDECTPYAGRVYYVGPLERDPLGFPKLASIPNGGPPFHPNCRHVLEPYVAILESPGAIEERRKESLLLPRRFLGKTAKEARALVAELSPTEIGELMPQGAKDSGIEKGAA